MSRIAFVVLVIGPWPVGESMPVRATGMAGRIDLVERGPLRVGVAVVDLRPPTLVPAAGFIGQIMRPAERGSASSCTGKAVTVSVGGSALTILGADLLLIDDRLARAVLARAALTRDQVYFTATHTHAGPGGWGVHPLERLVAGTYDPAAFEHLAGRLAEAVIRSRAELVLADVAFVQTTVAGLQRNRIEPGGATNDVLSAWVFRSATAPPTPSSSRPVLATLASFAAHATFDHSDPPRLGGDYPSAFAEAFAKRVGSGVVLFAAGTVGDASPVRQTNLNGRDNARVYGTTLADRLADQLESANFQSVADLANLGVAVALPPPSVPMFAPNLRFSPVASWWVGKRTTYLHVVKLGPAMLIGFPGDISGHLCDSLVGEVPVVATSFNGDYKGYLVSRATFQSRPCYETRWMSFFGGGLGEDLAGMAKRVVRQLLARSPDDRG